MSSLESELVAPLERGIRDLEEREEIARTEASLLEAMLVREPHRAAEHVKNIAALKVEVEANVAGRAALLGQLESVRAALDEAKRDGRLARIEELRASLDDKEERERIAALARDAAALLGKLRPVSREADQALSARWQELAVEVRKLGLTPPPRPATSAFVVARTELQKALREHGVTLSDLRS